jgi:hypothetical protein
MTWQMPRPIYAKFAAWVSLRANFAETPAGFLVMPLSPAECRKIRALEFQKGEGSTLAKAETFLKRQFVFVEPDEQGESEQHGDMADSSEG